MSMMNRIAAKVGIDKAVATGAAAVAGGAVFLIPVDVLENAVVKAGLDTMMAPLAPPLGLKARLGLALVVAGMVFGIVLAAMALIERFSRRPRKAAPGEEAESCDALPAAPRLRRRDSHPDAPARAPLSPVRELGLPEPLASEQEESPRLEGVAARLRRFQNPPEAAPEPELVLQTKAEPEPEVEPAPVIAEEPEPVAAAEPEPILLDIPASVEEAPFLPGDRQPEPEPERARPVFVPFSEETEEDSLPIEPEPQPAFVEQRSPGRRREDRRGQETIAELMERLERALGSPTISGFEPSHAPHPVSEPQVEAAPEPAPAASVTRYEEEPVGDERLRSALEHLKRVASRA